MFRIKICGITSVDDALAVAEAGGDAIGLNFYSGSPRVCTPKMARQIVDRLPATIRSIGVFVNAAPAEVRSIASDLGLDMVQLHGDEPPELLYELRGVPIVRAFRPGNDFAAIGGYLADCYRQACVPRMVLIDACAPGAYGGSGQVANWQAVCDGRAHLAGSPLVLAGGLTPANVEAAIATVRPWAVDVASGVEESPGKKSPERIRAFVQAAKAAFARLSTRG